MTALNNIITLDQLEGVEYMYKIFSTVLPSLCLDFTIESKYKTTYVHPFDALFSADLEALVDPLEYDLSVQKLGINYLLDKTSSQSLFNAVVKPGTIVKNCQEPSISDRSNPIQDTHSYNELPLFTKDLVKTRVTGCEGHARIIGGYVEALASPSILNPIPMPNLSFSNTYLLNLLYSDVIGTDTGFRARLVNGIMMAKDLINLLNVRALLTTPSREIFDKDYNVESAAASHNIVIAQNPTIDTDLTTMPYKHLVMYFQHFNSRYDLRDLTYNGDEVLLSDYELLNFIASLHFQRQFPTFKQMAPGVPVKSYFEMKVRNASTRIITSANITIPGVEFVDISSLPVYYITLFSMISRSEKTAVHKLMATDTSLFWDGIPYSEYKSMPLTKTMFLNSTCYVFGLYDHNGITYCSRLANVISSGKTPSRVCFLVRSIAGKTVPQLLAETLNSINSITHKDFPRKSSHVVNHIGLSEVGFMKFFQYLRLMANKTPETALKEVLMMYAGLKLEDVGPPHVIKKDCYKEFLALLFSAMGYKVSFKQNMVSSHNHVAVTVSPKVSKSSIQSVLEKNSCSKDEASKIMSSAHDLLQFMVSIGDIRDIFSYNINRLSYQSCPSRKSCPKFFSIFSAGNANTTTEAAPSVDVQNEVTTIDMFEPLSILERINVRGIMAATTTDEIIDTEFFMPENVAFKNNLANLINDGQLTGDAVVRTMPISMVDRYIQVGGGNGRAVSLSEIIDSVNENEDEGTPSNEIVRIINAVLKDNYMRDNSAAATQALMSVTALATRQFDVLRQNTCNIAAVFKQLAKSIYNTESLFKTPISDDVKEGILQKFKLYTELSKELYLELIALETIRGIMYLLRRNGKSITDSEISADDLRKAYELVKPKVAKLANYYSDISKMYYMQMKKNLNMANPESACFDTE
ncbi:p4a precursor [Pteropox virus]|uniref:p4a n=1 Tax=Pteropox virus TaxID=1873698 RepID=A0A1B1MRH6_9POXV|nr:p4a precursor [Pteropox virus]ANS71188.1 p4a precursor [Pteropox virus]